MAIANTALLDPNSASTMAGTVTNPNTTQFTVGSNFKPSNSVGNVNANAQQLVQQTAVNPQGGSTAGGSKSSLDIGNLTSNLNSAKSLFGGLNSSVDNFGSSLGFSNPYLQGPTQSGAALGASQQAGTFTGASLGQTLGAAGFGYAAGGFMSKLTGGNPVGSSIGGAIGGVAGSIFLSGLSTGIGAELGATIGSVVPGIGTVIGAAAGSLLGGMFGGGTPHPGAQLGGVGLDSSGNLSGGNFSGKHLNSDFFNPITSDFSDYLQTQKKSYGINSYNGSNLDFGYVGDGNHPGIDATNNAWIGVSNTNKPEDYQMFAYNPNDDTSRQTAYKNAFNKIATNQGLSLDQLEQAKKDASTVKIPKVDTPSTWQQFLDNYRQQHTTTQAS
jgi:hypothetical protein